MDGLKVGSFYKVNIDSHRFILGTLLEITDTQYVFRDAGLNRKVFVPINTCVIEEARP